MQILRHVSYTWLLAHAIHLVIWIIVIWYEGGDTEFGSFKSIIGLSIIALVASVPAIPVYCVINKWIVRSPLLPGEKFVIWLLCAPLITTCAALALMVFIADFEFVWAYIDELILYAVPSVVATVLSVCARYDYFIEHNTRYNSVEEQS